MKYLLIISSTLLLSCKSKYSEPLKTLIKESFNENQNLNKTKFVFKKQKRVYDLKHNFDVDSVINYRFQTVANFDLYFHHDYLYSFKTDSGYYYNIAELEHHTFIIHKIKQDSVVRTLYFNYYDDTIPFIQEPFPWK